MNPGTVLGQSIAASLMLSALAVLGRPLLALGMAVAGGAWAIAMNNVYARSLGDQARTKRRNDGDRAIALQLLVSYATPALLSLAIYLTGSSVRADFDPFHASEVQGLLGVVAAMFVAWLVSSHVDWYYVRPRIDGVVVAPPCRTSRDSMWKGVTRKWYIHRTFASLVTMGAVVAVATIVTVLLAREWPDGLGHIGGFAAIAAVGLWLMRGEIASVVPTVQAIRSPRYWLGDDLSYETDKWNRRGFVLHVAIPVTKLIPLDFSTGTRIPDEEPREEPATLLHEAHCRPRRFAGCGSADACRSLNAECTYYQPKVEDGRKRVLIF